MTTDTDIIGYVAAIVSFVAIVVTLLTALTAVRQSAFNNLQAVVERLEKNAKDDRATIEELRVGLNRERKIRMQYEDYIHELINRLRSANIPLPDISLFVDKGEIDKL